MIMIMKMAAPTTIPVMGSWLDDAAPAPTATGMTITMVRTTPQDGVFFLGPFAVVFSPMKTLLSF